jgi:heat shock protein HslJ
MSKLALLAVLALTAVGCLGSDFEQSLQGSWQLTSGTVDGTEIPLIDSHPITITFDGDRVSGTAACNRFSGDFELSGSIISLGDLAVTEMGCFPPEVMELEMTFIDAITRATTVAIDNGLVLSGSDVELTFGGVEPVPDASLTNTVWVLDGLVTGDAVSSVLGERATLEFFTDGSVLGGTGCRFFSSSYEMTESDLMISELVSDGHECEPDLADQDEHVRSVLGDELHAEISANTLVLSTPGDLGLIYRAEG